MLTRAAIVVLGCLLLGCGSVAVEEKRTSATTRDDVRTIIADQLGKETASIKPYHTFERLGADDLDLVEIVIRVEYTLGVSIDEDQLVDISGAQDFEELVSRLTVREFEQVVLKSAK